MQTTRILRGALLASLPLVALSSSGFAQTAPVLPVVTMSSVDALGGESNTPNGNLSFRINRTGARTLPLSVTYALGGTATNGPDYRNTKNLVLTGTAVIPAGNAYIDTVLVTSADALVEGDETVVATLTAGAATRSAPESREP